MRAARGCRLRSRCGILLLNACAVESYLIWVYNLFRVQFFSILIEIEIVPYRTVGSVSLLWHFEHGSSLRLT